MKKIYIFPVLILFLLIVIVVEAGIILSRKTNIFSSTTISTIDKTSPIPRPEQKGRQAVYIAETAGLESASAALAYRGTVLSLSKSDSSQIAELTVKVVGATEDVSFYFDQATIAKTTIVTSDQGEQRATYELMQELMKGNTPIRIVFDYNILNNTANSIRLEML